MHTINLRILPGREQQVAGFIDLNDHARAARQQREASPFLHPDFTDRYLRLQHRKLGIDYSLGGYLENRADLWRGSYLGHDNACHLGIDVNVPANTPLTVRHPSTVEKIRHDDDQSGGWGSMIMFSLDQPIGNITHYLYAHLSPDLINVTHGRHVVPGDIVGALGKSSENGGWYEHLHVQAMTAEAWELTSFDGYDAAPPQGQQHRLFPDPLILL